MAPRTCSWDCARVAAALDLGRPQVVTPGFCAWKPPASPSALGPGFQVAYSFALHACAVRLLVGRPALPSAEQGLGHRPSGVPCWASGTRSCCIVSLIVGFCVEGWGIRGWHQEDRCLRDKWHEPDTSQRSLEGADLARGGKQAFLNPGLASRSCRSPRIPELSLGRAFRL